MKFLLSDHKLKQGLFVRQMFGKCPKDLLTRYQTIQIDKDNALYVGVRSGNHQIVRPFLISALKAKRQIRTVNNALIDVVERTLNGTYGFEEVADGVFRSRRLLNKLTRAGKSLR